MLSLEAGIEEKTDKEEEVASEEGVGSTEVVEEDITAADPMEGIEVKDNRKTELNADKAVGKVAGKAAETAAGTTPETEPKESTTDSSGQGPEVTTDTKNKNKEEEAKEGPEAPTKEVVTIGTRKETMTTRLLTGEEPTTTKGVKTEETEAHKGSTEMMIDSFDVCMIWYSNFNFVNAIRFKLEHHLNFTNNV